MSLLTGQTVTQWPLKNIFEDYLFLKRFLTQPFPKSKTQPITFWAVRRMISKRNGWQLYIDFYWEFRRSFLFGLPELFLLPRLHTICWFSWVVSWSVRIQKVEFLYLGVSLPDWQVISQTTNWSVLTWSRGYLPYEVRYDFNRQNNQKASYLEAKPSFLLSILNF